ncbi:uncharacterized protein LOC129802468 isoform X2 [Phlebotomus papatasi]|uniref:uncharacterized protein LOC129802468 isoform X2 n=1 Tax=Phlebotomus papatasi TaxID=29031 RepID=UPI0024836EBA|nr:uncharacterized protein LOC129802468 isoform X2 [Phlebotomus papatasi]
MMKSYSWILVLVIFVEILAISEGIYDPTNSGVKNRPIVREPLNRRPYERLQEYPTPAPEPGVTIHDQYSQVSMQRSGRHFGRSDSSHVMRIARPGSAEPTQSPEETREPLAQFQLRPPNQATPQSFQARTGPDDTENEVGVSYGTECPAYATGQFPYVMDCRQFLNCWKGRGYIQSCPPGTLFNPETSVCDQPSKVVCVTFDTPQTHTEAPAQRQRPYARLEFPPRGQNPTTIQSRGFGDSPTVQGEVKCAPGSSGLTEHPYDCTKFLNCANGVTYIQDCGPGTVFNPIFNVCDWPHNVDCGSKSLPDDQSGNIRQPDYGEGKIDMRTQFDDLSGSGSSHSRNIYNRPQYPGHSRGSTTDNPQSVLLPSLDLQPPRENPTQGRQYPSYDRTKGGRTGDGYNPQSQGNQPEYGDPNRKYPIYNGHTGPGGQYNPQRPGGQYNPQGSGGQYNPQGSSGQYNPQGSGGQYNPQGSGGQYNPQGSGGQYNPQVPEGPYNPRGSGRKYNPQGSGSQYNPQAIEIPSLDLEPPKESEKPGQQSNSQYPIYTRPQSSHHSGTPSDTLQPPPYPEQNTRQLTQSSRGGEDPDSRTFVIGLIPPPSQSSSRQNTKWSDSEQRIVNQWQLPWQETSTERPEAEVTVTFFPSYNREYYNNQQTPPPTSHSHQNQLPVSEALQALLRPYMRGSHSSSMDMTNLTNILQTTLPPMTGEQESLAQGGEWKPLPQGPSESEEEVVLPPGHSREWHRAHPHVPLPGQHNDNDQFPDGTVMPPGHSLEWHRAHPHVPLPGQHNHGHRHHGRFGPHGHHHHRGHHRPHHHSHHQHHHQREPESTTPTTETLSTPDPSVNIRFGSASTPGFMPLHPSVSSQIGATLCVGQFNCSNEFCVSQDAVCDGKNDCGNWKDESDCDHIGFEMRLSGDQGAAHEGRVEVKVFGQWGYVCDDKFDMRDADVVCRELGFPLGAAEVRGNSFYPPHQNMLRGEDSAIFLVDELDCRGNEKSIRECDFSGWGVHDCNAEEVVGVVCKVPVMTCPLDYWLCDTSQECIPIGFLCDNVPDCTDHSDEDQRHCAAPVEIRLVGGQNRLEGRVEVKYREIWGTVCDDDFNAEEAAVVCRSLGYHGPSYVLKNTFGPGTGIIWLDQVDCIGNETSLEECSHWHWGEHNCAHTEDVGIRCSHGEPTQYSVRHQSSLHQQYGQQLDSRISLDAPEGTIKVQFPPTECGRVKVTPTENEWGRQVGFKVINGSHAQRGFHPWQAAIRVRGSGKSSHWCGAVLISEQHLLTAAHCLVGYSKGALFIRLGDHHAEVTEPEEVESYIENFYVHENFRGGGQHMNNDIAIIVLKKPVAYTDHIQPICLPTKNTIYFPGMTCTISGWGSIQSGKSTSALELRAGTVPILSNDICREPHVYGNKITEGMFCAGSLDEGIDSCMGDSGGGLVCQSEGIHKLYGIISWGHHCGYANKPGVYVKVAEYIDWIWDKLNGTSSSTL